MLDFVLIITSIYLITGIMVSKIFTFTEMLKSDILYVVVTTLVILATGTLLIKASIDFYVKDMITLLIGELTLICVYLSLHMVKRFILSNEKKDI